MTSKNKWRIYCITEGIFTEGLVTDGDPAPTVCFNNAGHTVNSNSVVQKDSFTTSTSGNLSIVKDIEGLGNIGDAKLSVEGSICVGESITELTTDQGFDISEINYTTINEQTTPSNPSTAHHTLYFDSGNSKLKSIDTSGNVVVYNPFTTKGDLAVHNGSTTIRLPVGTNGQVLIADSTEASGVKWTSEASNTTASNQGVGGVGPFIQKTGDDLQFKNINTGSSKVTITDDTGNDEIDIDIVEANIIHQNLSGAGTNTHAQIDSHISNVNNPHSVTIDQITPTTTKGDLLVENGSNVVKLPVGSDTYILTANSSEATGLEWVSCNNVQITYDAIVAPSGGDYTTIKAAVDAGAQSIFIKNGIYSETGDINLTSNSILYGESPGGVIISFSGAYSINIDGSAREISTGTISVSHGSTTVSGSGTNFTTLAANDYIKLNDVFHKISSITNNSTLVLDKAFRGKTLSAQSFVAYSMINGINLTNLIISNATDYGINIIQGFHISIRDTMITTCGGGSNIYIDKSSECIFIGTIIENGISKGVHLHDSCSLLFSSCTMKNNNSDGVYIDNCNGIILDSCYIIQNDLDGIDITNTSTKINITDGVISGNNGKGINTDTGTGRIVMDSLKISNNNNYGIDFDGTDNIINDCIIDGNGSGGIIAGDNGIIQGNKIISNSGTGIMADNDDRLVISGNTIENNSSYGINAGTENTISGNVIDNNSNDGIYIGTKSNVTIVGNTIKNHTVGIDISSGATNAIVKNNSLQNNTTAYVDNSSTTNTTNDIEVTLDKITPTTTKGDILVEDGSNIIRLPVGTNGQVLVADSGEASGVKWANESGGGNDCLVKVSANDTTPDELVDKIVAATRTGLTISELNDAGDEDLQIDLTNQIKAPDGTYTVPTYSFDNDSNTGMYREGSGDLAFAQNGTCTLEIGTDNRVFMSNMVPNYETLVTTDQTFTNKKYVDDEITSAIAAHDGTNTHAQIDSHIANISNPHSVDISDVTPLTTKGDVMVRNATVTTRLAVGTNGQILVADSTESKGVKWADCAPGTGTSMVGIVKDIKSSGTNGGTFTSGAWRTRDLNTLEGNASSRVSLSSNQITLQAGKYYLKGSAPAAEIENHQCRLYNVTDSSIESVGTSISTDTNSGWAETISHFECYIDIPSTKTYKLQHRCNRSESGDGMGSAAGWGDELYSMITIQVLE